MIKITDFNMLCKRENLQNQQCIKYLISPLFIYIYTPSCHNSKYIKILNS